jgi:hypothetical protein
MALACKSAQSDTVGTQLYQDSSGMPVLLCGLMTFRDGVEFSALHFQKFIECSFTLLSCLLQFEQDVRMLLAVAWKYTQRDSRHTVKFNDTVVAGVAGRPVADTDDGAPEG